MLGIFAQLKAAASKALGFIVLAALAIGMAVWAFNNMDRATAVAGSVANAGAQVVITSADWVAAKAGGQAATTGPKVIYVQNEAPLRWHVGNAIKVWNKGLTNVQLKAGDCVQGAKCITVSQVSELPDEDGRMVLGKTHSFFGMAPSIQFNGAAVGKVPASYFPISACHELGHALGLDHRTTVKSCMHATVTAGVSTRPDAQDYADVNKKYGH